MTSERAGPSSSDIKRLFALSGNRCAFPKCRTPLVQGETLVGELCHIRAASPGGPRYDKAQTAGERHAAANLILLCANHHAVIDDDTEAYTVERLLRMKADHEDHASIISDVDAVETGGILIEQSVSSSNQSGGITAHTVNLHAAPSSGVVETKALKAIEILWDRIGKLKKEFSEPLLVDTVLTQDELRACFAGKWSNPFFEMLAPYDTLEAVMVKVNGAVTPDAESQRPFVSPRLYSLFFAGQAVIIRAAMLMQLSFKKEHFQNWREDPGIEQQMAAVLPAAEIEILKASGAYSLNAIVAAIESAFIAEANKARAAAK